MVCNIMCNICPIKILVPTLTPHSRHTALRPVLEVYYLVSINKVPSTLVIPAHLQNLLEYVLLQIRLTKFIYLTLNFGE